MVDPDAELVIRSARVGDVPELARLVTELSYPTTVAEMEVRFRAIGAAPDFLTLVAAESDRLVGLLGMQITPSYERNGLVARVLVLVVDERCRSRGIGARMMEHAERVADEKGARRVVLSSAVRRDAAHRFYETIGYEKTGVRFTKRLPGDFR